MWSPDPSIIITAEQRAAEAAAASCLAQFPPLEPDRFWFALRATNYEPDVRAWVSSLNDPASPNHDPIGWAAVSAKLDFAKFFERDNVWLVTGAEQLGISEAELDAIWQFAAFG